MAINSFDPLIYERREVGISKTDSFTFENNKSILSEQPQKANRVAIVNNPDAGNVWVEVDTLPKAKYVSNSITYCEYRVNYTNGIIDVDPSLNGEIVKATYIGLGVILIPATRVYTQTSDGVVESLEIILDSASEFKTVNNYDNNYPYKRNNIVVYNAKSWIAKVDTQGNVPPTSDIQNDYWFLISGTGEAFNIDETGDINEAKIQDIIDNSGATPVDIYWFVVATDNRTNKTLPSTLNGDMSGRLLSYDGTTFHNFPFGGEKGETGESIYIQYSLDNINWLFTAPSNYEYIRFKQGINGTWGNSSLVKGIQGIQGIEGNSVYIQYSVDNTNWHDTLISTDIYIRFKIGVGGAWSIGKKFVGDKGDKGDTGIVGINWKNDGYVPATTYVENDALFYNGSSYRALKTISGVIPTNDGINWEYVAQKGADGSGAGDMSKSVKCRLTINSIYAGIPLELYKNNLYL